MKLPSNEQHQNILVPVIRALLFEYNGPVKLTELYMGVKQQLEHLNSELEQHFLLDLFSDNFLLMNAIYQIQKQDYDAGYYLLFDGLYVHYQSIEKCTKFGMQLTKPADVMADYYLDWNNYQAVELADVENLMQSFWNSYSNQDHLESALHRLGIERELNHSELLKYAKRRFLKLSLTAHPDKGGNEEAFKEIQSAYNTVVSYFG